MQAPFLVAFYKFFSSNLWEIAGGFKFNRTFWMAFLWEKEKCQIGANRQFGLLPVVDRMPVI